MTFKLKSKVQILSSKKLDGRYNTGVVVGVEMSNDNLIAYTEKDYFAGFEIYRYKVAYVDCFTNRCGTEWVSEKDIEKA